jgi:DNA-binding response OmpR family regulator
MLRILVIDDDPGTTETFQVILRDAGFAVAAASTGAQGLDCLRSQSQAVVLADLRLPDMSGIDVLRALRRMSFDTPFVMMSAFPTVESVVDALKLGARDYLEKPVTHTDLLEAVRAATTPMPAAEPSHHFGSNQCGAFGHGLHPVVAPVDSTSTDSRVLATLHAIEQRYSDPHLRLRTIACELDVSVEHLCRLIKRDTGCGFERHLTWAGS